MTELGHSANSAGYGSNHINPELDSLIDRANSLSIDDPGRCAAFQEAEQFFYQQYYTMMGLGLDDMSWLARPWLIDFEVTFGLDWGPRCPGRGSASATPACGNSRGLGHYRGEAGLPWRPPGRGVQVPPPAAGEG